MLTNALIRSFQIMTLRKYLHNGPGLDCVFRGCAGFEQNHLMKTIFYEMT
jgi:hypothetical protein